MANKILLSAGLGSAGVISYALTGFFKGSLENWLDKHLELSSRFPPTEVPALPPQPGYKVIGYMGCPESCISEIAKKKRLLFFAKTPGIPQMYALNRTSWLAQLMGQDSPVVLQLEIPETQKITENDLWKDRNLVTPHTNPFAPQFISFSPAIPPDVQREKGVEFRVNHHVTWENFQGPAGSRHRAFKAFLQSLNLFQ